jgi:hypothetical protein
MVSPGIATRQSAPQLHRLHRLHIELLWRLCNSIKQFNKRPYAATENFENFYKFWSVAAAVAEDYEKIRGQFSPPQGCHP